MRRMSCCPSRVSICGVRRATGCFPLFLVPGTADRGTNASCACRAAPTTRSAHSSDTHRTPIKQLEAEHDKGRPSSGPSPSWWRRPSARLGMWARRYDWGAYTPKWSRSTAPKARGVLVTMFEASWQCLVSVSARLTPAGGSGSAGRGARQRRCARQPTLPAGGRHCLYERPRVHVPPCRPVAGSS